MKKKFYNVSESYGFGLKQFLGSTLFYSDYIRKVLFFYYNREGGKVKKKTNQHLFSRNHIDRNKLFVIYYHIFSNITVFYYSTYPHAGTT